MNAIATISEVVANLKNATISGEAAEHRDNAIESLELAMSDIIAMQDAE